MDNNSMAHLNAIQIELLVKVKLNDFILDSIRLNYIGNRIWTKRLKERIASLGDELNCKVAVGGFGGRYEREWLYDLVLYLDNGDGRLERVLLVVESEWGKKYAHIKYDFEKLLVANADLRLMICQSKKENLETLFNRFGKAIQLFNCQKGACFLCAVLDSID